MKKLAIIGLLLVSVFTMSFTVKSFLPCQVHLWTGVYCFNPPVAASMYCSIHTHYPPPTPAPAPYECSFWYTARIKCVNEAVPGTSRCTTHTVPPLALVDSSVRK